MVSFGYGKILDIDLESRKIVKRDIDSDFARHYIGGIGFGCKILYDEVRPEVDPLSPENIVIFANGPFTGTLAPCGGRTELTTKHPLTGSIGTGNTGGVWGARLKHAGFDVIVVRNKSEKPVYLWIDNDNVEIKEAGHLWGKDARITSDILREELSPRVAVMAIGQAGENLVRYAFPLNDYYHVAGRSGTGGVMGSKMLKAVAVRGTGAPKPTRPQEFREAVKEARERVKAGDQAFWKPGPTSMEVFHRSGERPGLGRSDQLKYATGKGAICYACAMNCYNDMGEVKEGKYAGLIESNITRTLVIGVFGGQLGIDNLPAIWKCKEVTQRLGMDYESAAGTIAFAMRLLEEGIITTRDTDGMELRRGDEAAIIQMLYKIALREGFGDVLADGSVRAAKRIGKGAEQYVRTVKGMESGGGIGAIRNGAASNWWFLGILTNPRGDLTTSTHFTAAQPNPYWSIDKYDMFEDIKQKIYSVPPEQVSSTWEGKAMMIKWFEDLHSLADALGICFFPTHMRLALGPTYLSRLFSAYTGFDTNPEDFMKSGERLFNLFKAYTVRQGLTRKDDCFPGGFNQGSAEKERIDQWLDEYYELRGWDKTLGVPTKEKLNELGLSDIAEELLELGRLP